MTRKLVFAALLLTFIAATGSAQMMGGGGGLNPISIVMSNVMQLPVASDGTVFVTRNVTGGGVDLAAIYPDGTDRWTFRLQWAMFTIAVNDTTVIVGSAEPAGMMFNNNTPKAHLYALALSDGKQLGKLDLDGMVAGITPYKGGFYAQVFIPDGTTNRPGFSRLERKLLALDNNGNRVWEKTLD